MNYLMLTD